MAERNVETSPVIRKNRGLWLIVAVVMVSVLVATVTLLFCQAFVA